MPAHSRLKDGVASLAYVAGIHVLMLRQHKDVDGRNKSGHDELIGSTSTHSALLPAPGSARETLGFLGGAEQRLRLVDALLLLESGI
jgi:hypothetical protein